MKQLSFQNKLFYEFAIFFMLLLVTTTSFRNEWSFLIKLIIAALLIINFIIMSVIISNQTKALKMPQLVRRAYLLRSWDIQLPFFIIFLGMFLSVRNLGIILLLTIVALIVRWFDLYRLDIHFNEEPNVNTLYLYKGRKKWAMAIESLLIIFILSINNLYI